MLAGPADARPVRIAPGGPMSAYVEARTAEAIGDTVLSAQLFAALAAADPANHGLAARSIAAALNAGQFELAVAQLPRVAPAERDLGARLLALVDEVRHGHTQAAADRLAAHPDQGEATFLVPLLRAWAATDRGDPSGAALLAALPATNPLTALAPEQRADMLLRLGRLDEGKVLAATVVAAGGGREGRLRLAFADALAAKGDRAGALAMVAGDDDALVEARTRLKAGQPLGMAVGNAAQGVSEMLVGLAIILSRDDNRALSIPLAQLARFADPANAEASIVTALFLREAKRAGEALVVLRGVSPGGLLAGDAADAEVQMLTDLKRPQEALARARALAARRGATLGDLVRLGSLLDDQKNHGEAASVLTQAIERVRAAGEQPRWGLYLIRASALESANRWPEARSDLQAGLALAPDEPTLLNFLGYGQLEHGVEVAQSEAMIRKALAARPDNPSITDSLGWALYKRGRLDEAIATLTKAAMDDPAQSEIHEHLGDVLYADGRRFEARFAWEAALVTAEVDDAARLRAKIADGLTAATAAR